MSTSAIVPEIRSVEDILRGVKFLKFDQRPESPPPLPNTCFKWTESFKHQRPIYEKTKEGKAFWRIEVPCQNKPPTNLLFDLKVSWDTQGRSTALCFKDNLNLCIGSHVGGLIVQNRTVIFQTPIPLSHLSPISLLLPVSRMADPKEMGQLIVEATYGCLDSCKDWWSHLSNSSFRYNYSDYILDEGHYRRQEYAFRPTITKYQPQFKVQEAEDKDTFTLFYPLPSQLEEGINLKHEYVTVNLPQALIADALITKVTITSPKTNQVKWTIGESIIDVYYAKIPLEDISQDQPLPCCLANRSLHLAIVPLIGEPWPEGPPQNRPTDHYFGTDGIQIEVELVRPPWEAIQRGLKKPFCFWKTVALAEGKYRTLGLVSWGSCPSFWDGNL